MNTRAKFFVLACLVLTLPLGFTTAKAQEDITPAGDLRYAAVSFTEAYALLPTGGLEFSVGATVRNLFAEKRAYRIGVEWRGVTEENRDEIHVWRLPEEFWLAGEEERTINFLVPKPAFLAGTYNMFLGLSDRKGNRVALVPLGEKEFTAAEGRVEIRDCVYIGDLERGVFPNEQGMIEIEGNCLARLTGGTSSIAIRAEITDTHYGAPVFWAESEPTLLSAEPAVITFAFSAAVPPGIYQLDFMPTNLGLVAAPAVRKTLTVVGEGGRLLGVTHFTGESYSLGETVPVEAYLELFDANEYTLILELLSEGMICAEPGIHKVSTQQSYVAAGFTLTADCPSPSVRATLGTRDGQIVDHWVWGDDEPLPEEAEPTGAAAAQWPLPLVLGGALLAVVCLVLFMYVWRRRSHIVASLVFFLAMGMGLSVGVPAAEAELTYTFKYYCGVPSVVCYRATNIWANFNYPDSVAPGETFTVGVHFSSDDFPQVATPFTPYVAVGINGTNYTTVPFPSGPYDRDDFRFGTIYGTIQRTAPMTPGPFTLSFALGGPPGYLNPSPGSVYGTMTVTAATPPAPTITLSEFSPSSIQTNQSSSITLNTTGATSCTGTGLFSGSVPVNPGTVSTGPMPTAGTYTQSVTCTGPGGSVTSPTRTLTVTAPVVIPPIVVNLSAFSPSTIQPGQSSVISLTTSGATSCTASGDIWNGPVATSYTNQSTGYMTVLGTYTQSVTCTGPGGTTPSVTRMLQVTTPITGPSASIYATGPVAYEPQNFWQRALSLVTGRGQLAEAAGSNAYITFGENARINWLSANADTCSINNSIGSVTPNNAANRTLTALGVGTHTYTITCRKAGYADAQDSVSIIVSPDGGGGGGTDCTSQSVSWSQGGASCSGIVGPAANGSYPVVSSTNGNTGTRTYYCNAVTNTYTGAGAGTCTAPVACTPIYIPTTRSCSQAAGNYGIPSSHIYGTADLIYEGCSGTYTYSSGCSATPICTQDIIQTSACSVVAGTSVHGTYIPLLNTEGTAIWTRNSCNGTIMYNNGCSVPVCMPYGPFTTPCGGVAGQYGIPARNTQGTATIQGNTCGNTYLGGCYPASLQYTITSTAGPNGSINPAGSRQVWEGTDLAFIITPDAGYEVDDLIIDGVSSFSKYNYYSIPSVNSNRTIHAEFVPVVPPADPDIYGFGCTIADGASSCNGTIHWDLTGTPSPNIHNLTSNTSISTNVTGSNVSVPLTHDGANAGVTTIAARSGTTDIVTISLSASCATSSFFHTDLGVCQANPSIFSTASPTWVRRGQTSTLTFRISADYPVECTLQGGMGGAPNISHPGSATPVDYVRTTDVLTSSQLVRITCTAPGLMPDAIGEIRINVLPNLEEI